MGTALAGKTDRTGHRSAALAVPLELEATEACPAVQRWDVKTLTDGLAGDVHLSNVERTTIDKLRHLSESARTPTRVEQVPTSSASSRFGPDGGGDNRG
jgi:hypothetical protein